MSGRLALNQAEAAEALGVSVGYFKREIRPYLKRVDVGRRMLFPVCELESWLTARTEVPTLHPTSESGPQRLDAEGRAATRKALSR